MHMTVPTSGPTTIQLCGRLVIEIEGRRVENLLPARQGRLLFAYLALNAGRPVRRAELLDCLWPRQPPADAAGALNTVVSRLRKVLGPTRIAGRSELTLVLEPDVMIDVRFAAEALDAARSAAAVHDWRQSWEQAHAALAVTERELLPGLAAPWLDEHRRRFEELGLESLEAVAEAGLGLAAEAGTPMLPGGREYAAAEQAAAALVERAPFRESGYQLHMRILAARGNVAEALVVYERLRQLLGEELGTDPSPVLVGLHERLLRGEHLEAAVVTAPAIPDPGVPDAGDFVGRDVELALGERALAR
jgi:DNA-binding SARP family transcriptional activator